MCSITTSKQAKEDLKAIILINEFVNLTMEKPSYIIKRGYPLQIFFFCPFGGKLSESLNLYPEMDKLFGTFDLKLASTRSKS